MNAGRLVVFVIVCLLVCFSKRVRVIGGNGCIFVCCFSPFFSLSLSGLVVVGFLDKCWPPSLNKKQEFCITITNTIYLLMCNALGIENKLITNTTLANKRET